MDLNGWLGIIAVFTAIFALLPREELILSFQKIRSFEKWGILLIVIFYIPFLILFTKLKNRIPFLNLFTIEKGFNPEDIAFAIFYICFLWLIWRLFFDKSKQKFNQKAIEYFIELLNEKSFEEFFKLFIKYNSATEIKKNWDNYKVLIFHPKFLNQVSENKSTYISQFWDKFDNEEEFKIIFRLLLQNPNSVYYSEIKDNWNNYSVMNDKQFLILITKTNIKQSIQNGIFLILSDFVSNQMRLENEKQSIYNQSHFQNRLNEEEGFELPLYFHIQFIGLLYNSAIEDRKDISTLTHSYTNMQSIYSSIIKEMINNMEINEERQDHEYPSNYHWLICKIFDVQNNWINKFCKIEFYEEKSSYISYFPSSLRNCMKELYDGFEKNKITQDFLNSRIYFNILLEYFYPQITDEMRKSIEVEIISNVPKKHIQSILNFALNEKFALDYDDLLNERFDNINNEEEEILKRLLKFIRNETKFLE